MRGEEFGTAEAGGAERFPASRGLTGVDEFAGTQTDGIEAGHRLARGSMERHRLLDLRRHPHPAPDTVLLEMAFVFVFVPARQFDVLAPCQPAQLFSKQRLAT